jgi:hypothetical protein
MLYFHSSKIASLTKYNKYTSNDEYVKLFIEMLYKKNEELQKYDEEHNNLKLLSNEEHIDEVILKNVNEEAKREIKQLISSEVENNDDLINKTSELKIMINKNKDICEETKVKITKQLNSKINCNYGTNTENNAINIYEVETDNKVYNNNIKLYVHKYKHFAICGKTDGFVKINDKEYIFETKNRKNRLFTTIPIYEKIQLLAYTILCKNKNIVFTQCINDKINIKQLDNYMDEDLWNNITLKLSQYSTLIYKLQLNNDFRSSFINLSNDKLKYEFLEEYLQWL